MTLKNIYQKSKYSSTYWEVDGVYFVLDPKWNKIALSVSGGADSALLAIIICDLVDAMNRDIEVHFLSNVRMWKSRPWQRVNSLDVYNYLREKFPRLHMIRHEGFIAPELEQGVSGYVFEDHDGKMKSGDQLQTRSFAEWYCAMNDIDAWYAGITQNPDIDVHGKPKERNDKKPKLEELITEHQGLTVCHPLKYTNKSWVIKQYKGYDLLDLLELTRSCEGDNDTFPEIFKGLNYTNYTPGQSVPECGKCFWCQERKWAIEQNK